MKKLIILLSICIPILGYSQSNVYYIGEPKTQVINEVKDKYNTVPKEVIQFKGISDWEYLELNWRGQKYLYRGRFNERTGICFAMDIYPLDNTILEATKELFNNKYLQAKVHNNKTAWVSIDKDTSIFIEMLCGGINGCKYYFHIKTNKSL